MGKISGVANRLVKVIYISVLLSGFLVAITVWDIFEPYDYNYYNYHVKCNNGKEFDPLSKPIDKLNYTEPYSFDENRIKSECEFGTSYFYLPATKLGKNYNLDITFKSIKNGSKLEQLKFTLIAFVVYHIFIEIIRRIILYIVFGKNFFTLQALNSKKS